MRKLTTDTVQSKHPQTNAAFEVALLIQVQNLKSTAKDPKGVYGVGQAGGGWERLAADGSYHHPGAGHTARKGTYLLPCDGSPTVPEGTLRSRTPWSPFVLLGFFFFPDLSGFPSSGCLGGVARLASALTSWRYRPRWLGGEWTPLNSQLETGSLGLLPSHWPRDPSRPDAQWSRACRLDAVFVSFPLHPPISQPLHPLPRPHSQAGVRLRGPDRAWAGWWRQPRSHHCLGQKGSLLHSSGRREMGREEGIREEGELMWEPEKMERRGREGCS